MPQIRSFVLQPAAMVAAPAGRLLLLQGAPSAPLEAAQASLQAPAAAGSKGGSSCSSSCSWGCLIPQLEASAASICRAQAGAP
jgi:hypothetical protein